MVDVTTSHEVLSFMDGSLGYNQIQMSCTQRWVNCVSHSKRIYYYRIIPFDLKNAGATYQHAMQKIFDDILHKIIECYVDDLVVKSRKRENHLKELRDIFNRLWIYQLKMNPLKCVFKVTSRKFISFIVQHRGIKIDQSKIEAIQNMQKLKNVHKLKSLQGRLAYIRRFISNLAGHCQPFNQLMKDTPFVWDDANRNALKKIKEYLPKPPVLVVPILGKLLILYIAAQEQSLGALLTQVNDEGKENVVYYLS